VGFLKRKYASFFLFGGVVVIWLIPLLSNSLFHTSADAGAFGDQFGSVTALFSGLAFAGLIMTLVYQSQALDAQQEELKLTRKSVEEQTKELTLSSKALAAQVEEMGHQRKEMEKMEEAQREQADHLEKQAFENTFFQLLKIWNVHVSSIQSSESEGRSAIAVIGRLMVQAGESANAHEASFTRIYRQRHEARFSPYFTLLLHLILHVHKSGLPDEAKKKYAQIIRANLTEMEKKLLLCNSSVSTGAWMKDLVEEYGLLKGLDENYRASVSYWSDKFDNSAFS